MNIYRVKFTLSGSNESHSVHKIARVKARSKAEAMGAIRRKYGNNASVDSVAFKSKG